MQRVRRLAAAVLVIACLAWYSTGAAQAAQDPSAYYAKIAQAFRTNPVFVDPSASPTITSAQAGQLDEQIKQTGHPIYLALIDNTETKEVSSPTEFLLGLHNALGSGTHEVIAVSTARGFYVGCNVSRDICSSATQDATNAVRAAGKHPVVFNVYRQWITEVGQLQGASSSNSNSSSNNVAVNNGHHKSDGGFPWWGILLIVLGAVALLGMIVGTVAYRHRAKRNREREERLAASRRSSMTSTHFVRRNQFAPALDKIGSNSVRVQNPDGGTVVVNNNSYSQRQSPGYSHYYGGGMYGGAFWPPGYYADPFWTWEMLALNDSIITDYHDRGNGGDASADGSSDHGSDRSASDSGTTYGGSSWNGDGGANGSGSSWGSSSNSGSDYGSSSFGSGSDFGGSSWGGGSDFGGSSGSDGGGGGW